MRKNLIDRLNPKRKEVKGMKKTILLFAMLVLSVVMVASANATGVSGLFATDGSPTVISDNSADFLINVDGSVSANGTPTVTQGDILFTIVGFNTIESAVTPVGGTGIGGSNTFNEVTAITAVKISSGPIATFVNGNGITMGLQYSAAPLGAGDTAFFDWSTGKILGGTFTFTTQAGLTDNGALFGIAYEDSSNDYNRDSTVQAGLNSATNGDFRMTLGLTGSDFLHVTAPVDLGQLALIGAGEQVDSSSIGINGHILDQNWPGLTLFDTFTGGNGGFARPGLGDWPVWDNLDITLHATAIPEPATISLVGLGLLGAAFFGYRRKK